MTIRSAVPHGFNLLFSCVLVAGQAGSTLVVTSDPPGAVVYLDDTPVGETPVTIERVTTGSHRVRLTKDGYLENLKVIDVGNAQAEHHVTLTPVRLHPGQAAAKPDDAAASDDDRSWLSKRKWLLLGAGGGGAIAGALLARSSEPVTAGSVLVSPSIGLQAATPITFASQGAGGGSTGTLTYSWNFGDGTNASGPLVTHVYSVPGTFTVTVDVGDGKKSSTATASVTVRSLAGTWGGTLAGALGVTMVLTHNGSIVTGTYSDPAATGPLSGSVRSTSPQVNMTISPAGFPAASYAADPSTDVNTLTGTYRQQGLTVELRLTRQ